MEKHHDALINELIKLLEGGSAHVSFNDAIAGLPADLRGVKIPNLPYTIWQLVEHIRIAQQDMLEFSKSASHQSPEWPEGYWPKEHMPANTAAWDNSLKQIEDDLQEFISLLKNADIYLPIAHGEGQTILREALQIADHLGYHVAEIIMMRRLLGAWKP
jgi:hypothetical protein